MSKLCVHLVQPCALDSRSATANDYRQLALLPALHAIESVDWPLKTVNSDADSSKSYETLSVARLEILTYDESDRPATSFGSGKLSVSTPCLPSVSREKTYCW